MQGDKVLMDIYEQLGVRSVIKNNTLYLQNALSSKQIKVDTDAPDIAQTIAVTCFGLAVACDITDTYTENQRDRPIGCLEKRTVKVGGEN